MSAPPAPSETRAVSPLGSSEGRRGMISPTSEPAPSSFPIIPLLCAAKARRRVALGTTRPISEYILPYCSKAAPPPGTAPRVAALSEEGLALLTCSTRDGILVTNRRSTQARLGWPGISRRTRVPRPCITPRAALVLHFDMVHSRVVHLPRVCPASDRRWEVTNDDKLPTQNNRGGKDACQHRRPARRLLARDRI